jgi:hypothetical protein
MEALRIAQVCGLADLRAKRYKLTHVNWRHAEASRRCMLQEVDRPVLVFAVHVVECRHLNAAAVMFKAKHCPGLNSPAPTPHKTRDTAHSPGSA